jgi:SAM-dependent methyltransferase
MTHEALSGEQYDAAWRSLGDFIRYNPGARHRRRLCLRILEGVHVETIADIGCGPGELLLALRARRRGVRRFVGADFAPETVRVTQAALPWAEIQQLDITQATLVGETFDLVTCCEVIEHVRAQREVISNLSEMVSSGGHLLVSCPTGRLFTTERQFGHVQHPTPQDLEEWGRAAGLRTAERYLWGYPGYLLVKHMVNINPKLSMKQFGSGDYNLPKRLINHGLYLWSFLSWPHETRACQVVWLYQKP